MEGVLMGMNQMIIPATAAVLCAVLMTGKLTFAEGLLCVVAVFAKLVLLSHRFLTERGQTTTEFLAEVFVKMQDIYQQWKWDLAVAAARAAKSTSTKPITRSESSTGLCKSPRSPRASGMSSSPPIEDGQGTDSASSQSSQRRVSLLQQVAALKARTSAPKTTFTPSSPEPPPKKRLMPLKSHSREDFSNSGSQSDSD